MIGANTKIIKAQRSLITDLINNGLIDEAKIMLENDYSMTREDEIAQIYNQLIELEQEVAKQEDAAEESEIKEEKNENKKNITKNDTTKDKKTK